VGKPLVETTPEAPKGTGLSGGEWKTVGCWQTCHAGCVNKVYVKDGIILQQKTDDSHADSADYPQQRSCIKGRSLRQFVQGADRLKYPMKRKNWAPNGAGDNSLRGRDEWERISWEEALDYVASEFKRIKETYGNLSIASRILDPIPFLCAFGGYTTVWGQQSKGGWPPVAISMKGAYEDSNGDRFNLRLAKLIVLWGYNPIYSAGGSNASFIRHAKEAGAKVIMVDPWFSPTAQAVADEWVPVRPGTDGALIEAIAYHMIENNLQDQAFLDKYCVGFDAAHMPEGEEGSQNFKDYIMGVYDGVPKTPERAAEICGTAPSVIRNLAEQMATTKPMVLKCGQAPGRVHNGNQYAQLFYTIGWMTGNLGKPGTEIGAADGSDGMHSYSYLVELGKTLMKTPDNIGCTLPRTGNKVDKGNYDPNEYYGIAYAEFWSAILTGKHTDFLRGEANCNIKCLVKFGRCSQINQNLDLSTAIEALRAPGKIEFNVTADFFMTPDCQYSDIVLPAATPWEREGGYAANLNSETIIFGQKVIEPLYEAMPDWWMHKELCKRLDMDYAVLGPDNPEQNAPTQIAETKVMKTDGSEMEYLAAVTEADIEKWGILAEPHEGRIPFEEIAKTGSYQIERSEGDPYLFYGYKDYVDDPVANPVKTRSGKLEIFSRNLEEIIKTYNTTYVDPLPKYVPAVEGYEDSFSDWDNKVKGEYPYQLLGIHIARQAHSSFGNVKSIAEVFANNVVINEKDALDLLLRDGDTVLISNPHGKAIRNVQISNRVVPGVLIVGQGNWVNLDDASGIDLGCNMNTLTGGHLTQAGHSPYNTVLVKIEKYSGEKLQPDYLLPQVIPSV
jgi:anaerobic dimethyl sulfoxide reductase subunit A